MHRIDTLCYNDAPWLLATVEVSEWLCLGLF